MCGTPIGNLEDITLRALRILKEVDFIAAEDTRRTRKLLSYYDVHVPLLSYHQYSRSSRVGEIVELLKEGRDVALVSDAGMPGISDPGQELVAEALANGAHIVPVPGPSALTAALSVSGLPTESFVFWGFLSRKGKIRKQLLQALQDEERTTVLYEAPYRIRKTLQELTPILGDRQVVLARELTKVFEEVLRGTAGELLRKVKDRTLKGEITVVVAGRGRKGESKETGPPDGRPCPASQVFD